MRARAAIASIVASRSCPRQPRTTDLCSSVWCSVGTSGRNATVRNPRGETMGDRRHATTTVRMLAAAAVIVTALTGRAAATQVDCDTPDDFCTGDPCFVLDNLEISVPSCVLDFS